MKNQNRIVLLLISVLALAGIAYIVAAGFDQDQYLEVVAGGRGPKGYPLQGVATFAAIATAESLIFLVILRPNSYRKSWRRAKRRALLALTASVALSLFWEMGVIHAQPFYIAHVFWLFLSAATMLLLFVVSAIAAWRNAHVKH